MEARTPSTTAPDRAAADRAVVVSVEEFVARTGLPSPRELVVCGCSGGADSTALLVALAERGCRVHAVYVDHGLRSGTESEARFVAEVAVAHGASHEVVRVVVERRGNLLANAREARYAALGSVARKLGARVVAVGHTATDQAETVAFRAARADVPHALAGMAEVRSLDGDLLLARPLLGAHRADTRAFVVARGLVPVEDPTNSREDLTRTRLRRSILWEPGRAEALLELSVDARARLESDDRAAQSLGSLSALDVKALADASDGVLLRLLRSAGLHRAGQAHARLLRAVSTGNGGTRGVDLGAGLRAVRTYDRVAIGRIPAPSPVEPVFLRITIPGRRHALGHDIEIAGTDGEPGVLGASHLPRSLVIRTLRPGDFWRGALGRRKLQDVFTDRKVPRDERRRLPLIAADLGDADGDRGGEVFFIAGIGPAPGLLTADGPGVRVTASRAVARFPTGAPPAGNEEGRLT